MPYETSDSSFGSGGSLGIGGGGSRSRDIIWSGVEFLPLLLVLDEILGVEKRHDYFRIVFVFEWHDGSVSDDEILESLFSVSN